MERELEALRAELSFLREDYHSLAARVERQEDRLSELARRGPTLSYSQALDLHEGVPFVASGAPSSTWSFVQEPETLADRGAPSELTWSFREQVAREIGGFIRRSLYGAARGLSGREKTRQLGSKYYLIARDFSGQLYNPIKVVTSYTAAKDLCARAGEFGDSVFVGVPTVREGRIAATAAGLDWPASVP